MNYSPRHARKNTSTLRRSSVALGATALLALVPLGAGAVNNAPEAQAQPTAADIFSNPQQAAQDYINSLNQSGAEAREFLAEELRNAAKNDPRVAAIVDQIDKLAPGLLPTPTPAPAPQAAPEPEQQPAAQPRSNPCPAYAKACVDIDGRQTWIQNNGEIVYGPVPHAPGKPGEETPRGQFTVQYKVKDEVSREFNNAPMPNAVYFTNSGHAFHAGNINYLSAGCVRLPYDASEYYFNNLNPGDVVFIW